VIDGLWHGAAMKVAMSRDVLFARATSEMM
jgi:hypothetical protein